MKVACVNLRLRDSLFKQWGLVTSKTAIYESAYRSYLHTSQKKSLILNAVECLFAHYQNYLLSTE